MSARLLACLAGCALLAIGACDYRAWLAQSDLFDGYRPELVDECCNCLARRGTAFPGAACDEAVLSPDGGVIVEGDGASIPEDAVFSGDDLDDVIDSDEIPCICDSTINVLQCKERLEDPERGIVVTGACISQGDVFGEAPCESACRDVLTFDPLAPPATN